MSLDKQYSPKYQLFADKIERQIRSGELAPGAPLLSLRKLIAANKVSQPTVARGLEILSQRGLLKHHPGRGYLVAGHEAPPLSVRQIAFLTVHLDSDTSLYLKGVQEHLDHEKYACSTFSTHADLPRFQQTINQVARLKPAGIVLTTLPAEIYPLDVSPLIDAKIPIVAIEPYQPELICDRVLISQQNVAEKTVGYIRGRNLQNLAMLIGPPHTRAGTIVATFREKLKGIGLDLPDDRIFTVDMLRGYSDPPDPFIDAELKMAELLENGFTGTLICGHDYPAIGALRAILKAGIKVPEEIKIISIMSCAANGASPMKLTTVDFHPAEIAHVATKMLTRRIEGYTGPLEVHYVAGDLIDGETT